MTWVIKVVLFIALAFVSVKFCNSKTDGFTLMRIQSDLPFHSDWEIKNPPLETAKVFNQKFTYLGSGGQCFAFVSEDGNYVLKFFKHHLRQLPIWKKIVPFPKKKFLKEKLWRKLNRDFISYKLGFQELKEETGLLYLQLNKTNPVHQIVCLVDKLGIEHRLNLDKTAFILQKRAQLAYPHLSHLLQIGDLKGAQESIESICNLIIERCQKGIHDEDAKIHRNFGFIGNKALLIDGGRLVLDPKRQEAAVQKEDLLQITDRLKHFLEEISPELADYLKTYLETRCNA